MKAVMPLFVAGIFLVGVAWAGNEETRITILWDQTVTHAAPIVEPDARRVLQEAMAGAKDAGLVQQKARDVKTQLAAHGRHPVALGLPRTLGEEDRVLARHRVTLAHKRIAPTVQLQGMLEALSRTYVFLDADDPLQRSWWRRVGGKAAGSAARLVVTDGNPGELSRRTGRPVWADQGGILTRRFALTGVPSVVRVRCVDDAVTAEIERWTVRGNTQADNAVGQGRSEASFNFARQEVTTP